MAYLVFKVIGSLNPAWNQRNFADRGWGSRLKPGHPRAAAAVLRGFRWRGLEAPCFTGAFGPAEASEYRRGCAWVARFESGPPPPVCEIPLVPSGVKRPNHLEHKVCH